MSTHLTNNMYHFGYSKNHPNLQLAALLYICDWLWENLPLTHKDKYLEICSSIIQSVISREGLKLHAYNLLLMYSYLIAIRLPTPQCTASCFSRHFRLFFINTTSTYIGVEGGGCWVATKWRVAAKLSNFLGEMA